MRQRGVTLIELMIGISIVSALLAVGVPAFSLWIQNTQNRTAAESVLNGLQLARNEAVKRNTLVRFNLTDDTGQGLVAWNVGCVIVTTDCPAMIQSRPAPEGGGNARVGIDTTPNPMPVPVGYFGTAISPGTGLVAGVTFDGMGQALVTGDITRIDITNALTSDARRYVMTIGPGGETRMCDPAVAFASNPQGCS